MLELEILRGNLREKRKGEEGKKKIVIEPCAPRNLGANVDDDDYDQEGDVCCSHGRAERRKKKKGLIIM